MVKVRVRVSVRVRVRVRVRGTTICTAGLGLRSGLRLGPYVWQAPWSQGRYGPMARTGHGLSSVHN